MSRSPTGTQGETADKASIDVVVTTAFVTFRVFFLLLQNAGVGTLNEQLGAASWFCWAVPLLITEAWLQGRKILSVRAM